MKFYIIILVCVFTTAAQGAQWSCDVQEKPGVQIIFDQKNETLWLQTANEKMNLITTQRISSWQMPKEGCDIQTNYDHGDKFDMYTVSYRCGFKLGGSFQIDFKTLNGYYLEDLYQGGNRNLYNFKSCYLE